MNHKKTTNRQKLPNHKLSAIINILQTSSKSAKQITKKEIQSREPHSDPIDDICDIVDNLTDTVDKIVYALEGVIPGLDDILNSDRRKLHKVRRLERREKLDRKRAKLRRRLRRRRYEDDDEYDDEE